MDENYWGIPRTSVFVDKTTGSHHKVSTSSAVPLSLDKSYNWPLLNRLILRFWPLGLRHGSDWLLSLLWHQYILITFVDTLTNSLHGTRPTELAVYGVVPIQIWQVSLFLHTSEIWYKMGRLISSVINIFQSRWVTVINVGEDRGSAWTPYPPIPVRFISSLLPPPLFFRVPPPQIQIFCQSPKPILPPPICPPPPPPPPPVTLIFYVLFCIYHFHRKLTYRLLTQMPGLLYPPFSVQKSKSIDYCIIWSHVYFALIHKFTFTDLAWRLGTNGLIKQ